VMRKNKMFFDVKRISDVLLNLKYIELEYFVVAYLSYF